MDVCRSAGGSGQLPTHGVWVDVVPHKTKIQITQIPAKTLARSDLNGRGISDIGSTIQAETGGAAAGRKNNVIEVAAVGPYHTGPGPDGDTRGVEKVIADRNCTVAGGRGRIDRYCSCHGLAMDLTMVGNCSCCVERLRKTCPLAQRGTLERFCLGGSLNLMDEKGNLVVRARSHWIADNQCAEQSAVHVGLNIADMIMEWPGADRFFFPTVSLLRTAKRRQNRFHNAIRGDESYGIRSDRHSSHGYKGALPAVRKLRFPEFAGSRRVH